MHTRESYSTATSQAANDLVFSGHANQRSHQRGLRPDDLALVLEYGEWVEDGCLLSERALASATRRLQIQQRRDLLQRLDHLRNVAVILAGDTVVTVYRADSRRVRRLRAGRVKVA